MMKNIFLAFSLGFHAENDPDVRKCSEDFLVALLGYNCWVNSRHLRLNPKTPMLYDSGVRYAAPDQAPSAPRISPDAMERVAALLHKEGAEVHKIKNVLAMLRGVEEFLDIPALYERGKGDCNELVPVRVAELWRAGIDAKPHLVKEGTIGGATSYHTVVLHPDGSDEDPSRILGMGDEAGRREEIRKNTERFANHAITGRQVAEDGLASPELVMRQMELLGLLPKDGVFRVGGPAVDILGGARATSLRGKSRRAV